MVHKETGHKISLPLSKREWRFPCRGKRGRVDFIVENRRDGTHTEYTWKVKAGRTPGVPLKRNRRDGFSLLGVLELWASTL